MSCLPAEVFSPVLQLNDDFAQDVRHEQHLGRCLLVVWQCSRPDLTTRTDYNYSGPSMVMQLKECCALHRNDACGDA